MWGAAVSQALAGYLQREFDQRGWNESQAAQKTGVSRSGLRNLIKEPDRVPDLRTLEKLAKTLEVPLRRLLDLAGFLVEDLPADEEALFGLTEEQREFLRNLSPEKKAAVIDLARRALEG